MSYLPTVQEDAGCIGRVVVARIQAATQRSARALVVTCMAMVLALLSPASIAADGGVSAQAIPWTRQPISVSANQTPVSEVLRQLFVQQNLPAVISPRLIDAVSGTFKGEAKATFYELASLYGLIWWFDGATVYVNAGTEKGSKLIPFNATQLSAVKRALQDLKLDRAGFSLKINEVDNYVAVSGPPRYLKTIEDALNFAAQSTVTPPKQATASPMEVRVFRLQHAWAKDLVLKPKDQDNNSEATVLPGMLTILRDILQGGDPAARNRNRVPNRTLQNPNATGPMASIPNGAQTSMTPIAGQAAQNTGTSNDPDSGAPILLDTGASIAADVRLNAIIVRDTADKMNYYSQLIRDLDVATHLVEIEATVIDLDQKASTQLGIEFGLANGKLNVNGPANANPAFSISTLIGGNRWQFLSRINALAADGQARLMSRPKVLTLINTEAVLSNSTNFFVRVAGRDVANLYNVRAGLTLRVTPHVVKEGDKERIRLIVLVEDGSTENTAKVDEIPVVNRNYISTQALINEGESLLVGGYTLEQSNQSESKVPVLGDLPVVGALFRQKQSATRKMERLFMITPRIVKPDEL